MPTVHIVDDEENIRLVLRTLLKKNGYQVTASESAEAALEAMKHVAPDFVITDVRMPGKSGIELTEEITAQGHNTTVIVMSAYGSIELALEAMKAGAYDYITKPFKRDEVLLALRKAEEREALRRENAELRAVLKKESQFGSMIGNSDPMKRVFKLVRKAAVHKTTVLVMGESGTGKELVARALHDQSPRVKKSFVAVNCGAIPEQLLESELFGHVRGAFTDARNDKRGLVAEADSGTLFLDEIGELPQKLQVKLLRVLQEGTIRPVGATKDQPVDVRVVAATVRDLEDEVKEGRFREDLFYRLNVLQVKVPPLRARAGDITLLLEHFIHEQNARIGASIRGFTPQAMKLLLSYPWPGNVRQLENLVERAVVLAEGERIDVEDLPERFREPMDPIKTMLESGELSIKKTARFMEETLIRKALEKTGGNRTAASKLLEISHRALLYKIKEYGLK